jgi:hypothetical protein
LARTFFICSNQCITVIIIIIVVVTTTTTIPVVAGLFSFWEELII